MRIMTWEKGRSDRLWMRWNRRNEIDTRASILEADYPVGNIVILVARIGRGGYVILMHCEAFGNGNYAFGSNMISINSLQRCSTRITKAEGGRISKLAKQFCITDSGGKNEYVRCLG